MIKDDIIRMAREAGISDTYFDFQMVSPEDLSRFAALVAAAEREACAKVCEGRIGGATKEDTWWSGFRSAMSQCADVIRARGDAANRRTNHET